MFSAWSFVAMLMFAMGDVESNNNPDAVGDNGQAVGVLQIHPQVIKDVNTITGAGYTLQDRYDPDKSREICAAYLGYHGMQYQMKTGKEPTLEVYARIWNGGPRGYEKPQTLKYWRKVQRAIIKRNEIPCSLWGDEKHKHCSIDAGG